GFEFDQITKDLLGASRNQSNKVGAITSTSATDPAIMDPSKYGPNWYTAAAVTEKGETHVVNSDEDLKVALQKAKAGDIIQLASGDYKLSESLAINKKLTIESSDPGNKAVISYQGSAGTPALEMYPKGELTLKNIQLKGTNGQYAFAPLEENMSSLYNLKIEDCTISNFDFILKAYKYSFAEFIELNASTFSNCQNGLELSEEREDKGEYNAENLFIDQCRFENIGKNVVDYYRGGYDESTVGGNLRITNSSFTNCGGKEENSILLNTYGIINVDISKNTFENNPVQLIAQLWGAKNNSHSNNTVSNSGRINVEQNLKLNLLY
ncbi:MAG: DUF4957 domain-containing protein, partial [Bacteroidota bacterium]